MSGHNKWAQIKRQKGAEDARKSKRFAMLGRMIAVESKKAAGNVSSPGLRAVIEKARKENMPNDTIDRAVKRGSGADAPTMEEFLMEGYGPGGIAIVVEGLTDSKNRTINEIKHIFAKHGATLASPGAAIWAFAKSEDGPDAQVGASWKATNGMDVPDDVAETLGALITDLESNEDVKAVATNASA